MPAPIPPVVVNDIAAWWHQARAVEDHYLDCKLNGTDRGEHFTRAQRNAWEKLAWAVNVLRHYMEVAPHPWLFFGDDERGRQQSEAVLRYLERTQPGTGRGAWWDRHLLQPWKANNDKIEAMLDRLRMFAKKQASRLSPAGGHNPDPPASAWITSLGECRYGVDGREIPVEQTEDVVFQVFLKIENPDQPLLVQESGVRDATRILRKLTTKYGGVFAPYITLPGKRGNGGYGVKIRMP